MVWPQQPQTAHPFKAAAARAVRTALAQARQQQLTQGDLHRLAQVVAGAAAEETTLALLITMAAPVGLLAIFLAALRGRLRAQSLAPPEL